MRIAIYLTRLNESLVFFPPLGCSRRVSPPNRHSPALFYTNFPTQCGIAKLDASDKIIKFTEKPTMPESNLANAGIYVANRALFDYFPKCEVFDLGHDILPLLVNNMQGYLLKDYLIDIGNHENYQRAQKEWKNDNYKNAL